MKVKVKTPNVCYIVNARQTGVLRVNKHDTAMSPSPSFTRARYRHEARVLGRGGQEPQGGSSHVIIWEGADCLPPCP